MLLLLLFCSILFVSFILNCSQIPDFLILIISQNAALAMHVVFQLPGDTCDLF